MIGVGFRILTRTPVPKLPRAPPPPSEFKTFSLFVYINCVQLYSLIQVVLIDDEISPRASLQR